MADRHAKPELLAELDEAFKSADVAASRGMIVAVGLLLLSAALTLWSLQNGAEWWGLLLMSPAIAGLWWMVRSGKMRDLAWEAADAGYARWLMRTSWVTPAGAVGVAISVHSRGRRMTLAFPSGLTHAYDRAVLRRTVEALSGDQS